MNKIKTEFTKKVYWHGKTLTRILKSRATKNFKQGRRVYITFDGDTEHFIPVSKSNEMGLTWKHIMEMLKAHCPGNMEFYAEEGMVITAEESENFQTLYNLFTTGEHRVCLLSVKRRNEERWDKLICGCLWDKETKMYTFMPMARLFVFGENDNPYLNYEFDEEQDRVNKK